MKQRLYPIWIECLEEGGYYAECPILQGCHVEGETFTEAVANLEDAIRLILQSYKELGKRLPKIPKAEGNLIINSSIPIQV